MLQGSVERQCRKAMSKSSERQLFSKAGTGGPSHHSIHTAQHAQRVYGGAGSNFFFRHMAAVQASPWALLMCEDITSCSNPQSSRGLILLPVVSSAQCHDDLWCCHLEQTSSHWWNCSYYCCFDNLSITRKASKGRHQTQLCLAADSKQENSPVAVCRQAYQGAH